MVAPQPAVLRLGAWRQSRFRREAQVLASLNHPHIDAIYLLEEAPGVVALALELVEGEDLVAVPMYRISDIMYIAPEEE